MHFIQIPTSKIENYFSQNSLFHRKKCLLCKKNTDYPITAFEYYYLTYP